MLIGRIMPHATIARIRKRAAVDDEGAIALLVLTMGAALASLAAAVAEVRHAPSPYRLVLGAGTPSKKARSGHSRRKEVMRTWFFGLGTLSAIFWTSMVAQAQETLDVTKITCKQFVSGEITDPRAITIWFSGFFHGMRNNTILDKSALFKEETDLHVYCSSHLNEFVMDVVKNGREATTR